MKKFFLAAIIIGVVWTGTGMADKVTLDTGNSIEGKVREENDKVTLEYFSLVGTRYQLKTITIPKARIQKIEYDPSYFQKYVAMTKDAGMTVESPPAVDFFGGNREMPLENAIKVGRDQVQESLDVHKEHMRKTKFYYGWHEGMHYDSQNGWHHQMHEGPYDPDEVTPRE